MRTAGRGVRKIRNVRDVRHVCAAFVPIPMPHVRGIRPIVSTVPVKVVMAVNFKTPKENAMLAAGIMWLNMWTNLSVLNVKDNGFITTLISDVSLVIQQELGIGPRIVQVARLVRNGIWMKLVHAIYALEKLFLMRPIIQSVVQLARPVRCGPVQNAFHVMILYRSGVLFMINPAWNNAPAFGYPKVRYVFVVII